MSFSDVLLVFYDYIAAVYMANRIVNELKNKISRSTKRSLMGTHELQMKKHKPRYSDSRKVQWKRKLVRADHSGQRLAICHKVLMME